MSAVPGVDTFTTRTSVPLTNEYPLARVDLLPPEIIAGRRFKVARGWMATGLVATLALTGGVFLLASADADTAAEQLALEQARTADLNAEAAQYAAVPAILASVERAESALDIAMATDIEWYRYLAQMGTSTPEGLWFTSMSLTVAPPTPGGGTGGDPLAPVDTVADVQTIGRALAYQDVAAWMDNLDAVTGYQHVLFTQAQLNNDAADSQFVDFTVSTKVLADAYSNRYVSEAG